MLPLTFVWALEIKVKDKDAKVLKSSTKYIIDLLLNQILSCHFFCKGNNSAHYAYL